METDRAFEYRRALEALRNGVPNRDAVRELGTTQPELENAFLERIGAVESSTADGKQVRGFLIAGDFGSGKSHVLDYFEHLANTKNFVTSRVVVSKETPLFDPEKVYLAAIEDAEVPGFGGEAMREMIVALKPNTARYREFSSWVNSLASQLHPIFAATVLLHEKLLNDPELIEQITRFWLGGRIALSKIKQGLKQINSAGVYALKQFKVKELAPQRFRFLARLIQAAGYAGWVLLLDEVELVGRYSLMQRGRSYSELARWMGLVEGEVYPGLTTVAAITGDYTLAVLQGKSDLDLIGDRFRKKEKDEYTLLAGRAETGMRLIERKAMILKQPDDAALAHTYRKIKSIHAKAYGWDPPEIPEDQTVVTGLSRQMRSYVRRWVNEWDLKRLYPEAETSPAEEDQIALTYETDETLELAPESMTEE
ncbi:MAG TPA: BREX system ATP-binding domain-containing protein [Bryobacteraceae bacterium]|nr:BREX system ATP-binding domain-containing protein [Bryobacteraceae bacterium]